MNHSPIQFKHPMFCCVLVAHSFKGDNEILFQAAGLDARARYLAYA